jgi:tetratricopeptide (TPR) repeat protein
MLATEYPSIFKGDAAALYREDMLNGVREGYAALGEILPAQTPQAAMASVAMEIELLRAVRKYRAGSYFYYRVGVLASLTADVLMPYGIPRAREEYLKQQIEADIDSHLQSFVFTPSAGSQLQVLRRPVAYLSERRQFFDDARAIIAADYKDGKGYDGYLRTGGEALFGVAVEGVANAVGSILHPKPIANAALPSDRSVMEFFILEVAYLLKEKDNPHEAEKAYACFINVNPGDLQAYERMGDVFYDYGLRDRGVQEWKMALAGTGPERRRVLKKLANHYLRSGRQQFESASSPEASDTALEDALKAFSLALEYDPESPEAGERLSETRQAIQEKQERYDLVLRIIATSEKVMMEAQEAEANEAYADAIAKYDRAKLLYDSVTDEFTKQHDDAVDGILLANNQISRIINKRLDAADELIDAGDQCIENDDFEGALNMYNMVPDALAVVPEDPSTTHGQNRQRLLDDVDDKIAKVEVRKKEYEQRKADEAERRRRQQEHQQAERRRDRQE